MRSPTYSVATWDNWICWSWTKIAFKLRLNIGNARSRPYLVSQDNVSSLGWSNCFIFTNSKSKFRRSRGPTRISRMNCFNINNQFCTSWCIYVCWLRWIIIRNLSLWHQRRAHKWCCKTWIWIRLESHDITFLIDDICWRRSKYSLLNSEHIFNLSGRAGGSNLECSNYHRLISCYYFIITNTNLKL